MRFSILLLTVLFSTQVTAEFKRCQGTEKSGERCIVKLGKLHPTQFSIGKITSVCKQRKLEQKNTAQLRDFLFQKQRHIPVYIAEQNVFYTSNKHHLLNALYHAKTAQWQGKETDIVVRIIANYNYLGIDRFWNALNDQQQVWGYDENGKFVSDFAAKFAQMNLGDLKDNPYRTLSRWVRKNCGYIKKGHKRCEKLNATQNEIKNPAFLEMYWARYFRQHFNEPSPQNLTQLQNKLPEAIKAALDKKASADFFQNLTLNVTDYGQNQTGKHLPQIFNNESCE